MITPVFLLHMLTHIQMDRKFQLEGHLSISRLSALISQEMFPGDSFEIFQNQNIIFVPNPIHVMLCF